MRFDATRLEPFVVVLLMKGCGSMAVQLKTLLVAIVDPCDV